MVHQEAAPTLCRLAGENQAQAGGGGWGGRGGVGGENSGGRNQHPQPLLFGQ